MFWIWLVGAVVTVMGLVTWHIIEKERGEEGFDDFDDAGMFVFAMGLIWPLVAVGIAGYGLFKGYQWVVVAIYRKITEGEVEEEV